MRLVIIGGDAAGMSAASRAKRIDKKTSVTVLERTMDVSYSACGMPYNISDVNRDIDDLVVRRAEVFRQQGIELMTGYDVHTIDPDGRIVAGKTIDEKSFEYPYDRLLIATGASAVIPDISGSDLPGVMVLKSLNDGRKMKSFMDIHHVRDVVIVGMGYIGMEMCEAFRARGVGVDMVGLEFLPGIHPEISKPIQKTLEANGVRFYTGRQVEKIEKINSRLLATCSDHSIEGDLVLMGVGVRPNSRIAKEAGITLGAAGAVAVDDYLKTSAENIYSAGDCAEARHAVTGKPTWMPLGLRANRSGRMAADSMLGSPSPIAGVVGTQVFKVFDLQVAGTGLNDAEAKASGFDPVSIVIENPSRAHSYPGASPLWVYMVGDRKSGRLLGVQMVGREGAAHRINAPAIALHNRMSVADFAQADLAYAPPFGPVWDPMLIAANQLLKDM